MMANSQKHISLDIIFELNVSACMKKAQAHPKKNVNGDKGYLLGKMKRFLFLLMSSIIFLCITVLLSHINWHIIPLNPFYVFRHNMFRAFYCVVFTSPTSHSWLNDWRWKYSLFFCLFVCLFVCSIFISIKMEMSDEASLDLVCFYGAFFDGWLRDRS